MYIGTGLRFEIPAANGLTGPVSRQLPGDSNRVQVVQCRSGPTVLCSGDQQGAQSCWGGEGAYFLEAPLAAATQPLQDHTQVDISEVHLVSFFPLLQIPPHRPFHQHLSPDRVDTDAGGVLCQGYGGVVRASTTMCISEGRLLRISGRGRPLRISARDTEGSSYRDTHCLGSTIERGPAHRRRRRCRRLRDHQRRLCLYHFSKRIVRDPQLDPQQEADDLSDLLNPSI